MSPMTRRALGQAFGSLATVQALGVSTASAAQGSPSANPSDLKAGSTNSTKPICIIRQGIFQAANPDRASHCRLVSLHEARGVGADEIARLTVLDVKPSSYFSQRGASDQHGAGNTLFAEDREFMARLFNR